MATKIKGSAGRNEAYPGQTYRFTDTAPGIGVPATLVLGDELVYTASEVRAAALAAIKGIHRVLPQSPEHVGRAGGEIAKALLDIGITLDPA